jgi:hypothetical protein
MNEATSETSSPINQFTTAETRTTPLGEHSQGDVDDTHRYFRRTDVTPAIAPCFIDAARSMPNIDGIDERFAPGIDAVADIYPMDAAMLKDGIARVKGAWFRAKDVLQEELANRKSANADIHRALSKAISKRNALTAEKQDILGNIGAENAILRARRDEARQQTLAALMRSRVSTAALLAKWFGVEADVTAAMEAARVSDSVNVDNTRFRESIAPTEFDLMERLTPGWETFAGKYHLPTAFTVTGRKLDEKITWGALSLVSVPFTLSIGSVIGILDFEAMLAGQMSFWVFAGSAIVGIPMFLLLGYVANLLGKSAGNRLVSHWMAQGEGQPEKAKALAQKVLWLTLIVAVVVFAWLVIAETNVDIQGLLRGLDDANLAQDVLTNGGAPERKALSPYVTLAMGTILALPALVFKGIEGWEYGIQDETIKRCTALRQEAVFGKVQKDFDQRMAEYEPLNAEVRASNLAVLKEECARRLQLVAERDSVDIEPSAEAVQALAIAESADQEMRMKQRNANVRIEELDRQLSQLDVYVKEEVDTLPTEVRERINAAYRAVSEEQKRFDDLYAAAQAKVEKYLKHQLRLKKPGIVDKAVFAVKGWR